MQRVMISCMVLACSCAASFAQNSVLTQHIDNARTGWNSNEPALNSGTVAVATFGKLFTRTLDADVGGQVLIANNVTINGTLHANVMIAFTSLVPSGGQPSSLYAFDADDPAQSAPLWKLNFTASDNSDTSDTPVIDPATGTIYVVTKVGGVNKLHAVDITKGTEKTGSPVTISATIPGTGDGSSGGNLAFNSNQHNCHPGLLLLYNGGVPYIYIAFAHNSDSFPYHGWVFGYTYDQTKFTQTSVYCTTPKGGLGGIWQGGKGLVADSAGFIYCTTGNGVFDLNTGGTSSSMCFLKLSTPNLAVADYFSPANELNFSNADSDVGNTGPTLIPGTDRIFAGGTKYGNGHLVSTSNMGHWSASGDTCLQTVTGLGWANAVSFAGTAGTFVYLGDGNIKQYKYDATAKQFASTAPFKQNGNGDALCISSGGANNPIVWSASSGSFFAFDGTDVSKPQLWDSTMNSARDGLGSTGHFQFPTVANSKVYVPTDAGTVVIYGFIPTGPKVFASISVTPASGGVSPNGTQQFTATALDQFGTALASQPAITWSVSGGGSINSIGLFTAGSSPGTFTVSATSGINVGNASITIDLPPVVVSPASVTPTSVVVNVPATFSGQGSDPAGGTITYSWNFGDGSTATGVPATHTYTAAGNYTVTLTMTNSIGGTTISTMNITVTDTGVPPANAVPMTVLKVHGTAKFTGGGHDSCSLSGTIPNLPKLFDPAGMTLVLSVKGASVSFPLDSKGHSHTASGTFTMKLKPTKRNPTTKKNEFQGGNVAFTAKIQNGTWAATWSLDPKTTAKNVSMDVPATILLNGTTYTATITATYTGKAGIGGTFKK